MDERDKARIKASLAAKGVQPAKPKKQKRKRADADEKPVADEAVAEATEAT